jgi:peptidoglycan hydrolase CwlO-like protein
LIGLLAKAHRLRDRLSREGRMREESLFDSESGISAEDQREIQSEIERVATQSRLRVTPEVFIVRAVKRGVFFPIIANVGMLALLLGAVAFSYLFNQQRETINSRGQSAAITAEGKLIEEVRREAQAQLEQKNQEIGQIQSRLSEIDRQRQDLQSNMDAKVSAREAELRAAMNTALEAERKKLQEQGLSQETIDARLKDLEAQKNAEFARQLDAFKAQADADRKKAEESLKNLQNEYSVSLERANAERQQVISDSQKRENELKSQLAQATQELQTAKAQSEQALQTIAAQKEKEDLALGQLTGLYSVVKANVTQRNYQAAIQGLKAVGDFVNRQDIMTIPAISQRRDFDLFVINSLTALVQDEMDKSSADTASLVQAAGLISDIRTLVSSADGLLKAGKGAEAEKAYAQALQVIPEVARSYAYLSQRVAAAEQDRQNRLGNALAAAEAAFEAGKTSDALVAYRQAFTYLPLNADRLDKTMSNVTTAGYAAGIQKAKTDQSKAAAGTLAQADGFAAKGQYDDALASYIQILARYPASTQTDAAMKGIETSVAALVAKAEQNRAQSAEMASIQSDLKARTADISRIKRFISQLIGAQGDPETASIDSLLSSLQSKYNTLASTAGSADPKLQADLKAAQDQNKTLAAQIDSLKASIEEAKSQSAGAAQQLSELQGRITALNASYNSYVSLEDPLLASRGSAALLDTKAYLDAFLGSKSVNDLFPGILERIRRYDMGFEATGRTAALQDALDVVVALTQAKDGEQRKIIMDRQLRIYQGDSDMTDLLKGMQGLIQ